MASGTRSAREIRTSIERTRAELVVSVDDLRRAVERSTDWRRIVRENRTTVVVAAAALGFLAGGGLGALGGLFRRG